MKRIHYRQALALLSAPLLGLMLLAGCADDNPAQPDPVDTDTAWVPMTFNIRTVAGATPFALDSMLTSESGISYKISKLIYYIQGINLVDTAGQSVAVEMVDNAEKPLPYNIALVDYALPESMTIRVLAPRGNYKGLNLTVGVPLTDASGQELNHVDASAMEFPLNVDADMYWGWKAGYIFLKAEGRAQSDKEWLSFFYHLGDDKRIMPVRINEPFTVAKGGASSSTLEVNVNKLFVTPIGEHSPNMIGEMADRMAHGGTAADIMSRNVINSGFITLKP